VTLVLDEHFSPAVAEQLEQRGYDVIPVAARLDAGLAPLRRKADEELLRWAHSEGRVLVTENVRDFMPLHHSFLSRWEPHSGIIFTSPRRFPCRTHSIGLLVDALARFMEDHVVGLEGDIFWL
jgi:predicted nuclease of predicted toxin-antitoxin system